MFADKHVWEAIRSQTPEVQWFSLVWYSQCNPRHTNLLWMAIQERLQTQNKSLDGISAVMGQVADMIGLNGLTRYNSGFCS